MLKKYYAILSVSVMVSGIIFILASVIQKTTVNDTFAQIKKQDLKEQARSTDQTQSEDQKNLITQHLKNKEYDSAIKLGKEYLASNPNDITAIDILTEAYINKGDLSAAETTVKKAVAIQPNDPWSCRLLARIYRIKTEKDAVARNNNLNLALQQAEKGLASNPNDIWLLAEVAQIYFEQGDKVKANKTIDKALGIRPNDMYLKSIKEMINKEPEKTIKK